MTAIALLNPSVSANAILAFQKISPTLKIDPDLKFAAEYDAALIFGGDGTVHRYLPQLHKRQTPLLVVPYGSGNDFAKALGISSARIALAAWQQFCNGAKNVKEIDLGMVRCDGRETVFCCVAGAGLDAESNKLANGMPDWVKRHGGYFLAAVTSLFRGKPAKITVWETAAGAQASSSASMSAWLVAVGNAHRYGGGVKMVPQARLDDGVLDICLVEAMNKLKVLFVLPSVFWGGHTGLKEVHFLRMAALRVETEPPLEIYADGEPAARTPAEFSVLPGALKVIVPM